MLILYKLWRSTRRESKGEQGTRGLQYRVSPNNDGGKKAQGFVCGVQQNDATYIGMPQVLDSASIPQLSPLSNKPPFQSSFLQYAPSLFELYSKVKVKQYLNRFPLK